MPEHHAGTARAVLALAASLLSALHAPAQGVPLSPIGQPGADRPPAVRSKASPPPEGGVPAAAAAPALPTPREVPPSGPATRTYDLAGLTALMLQRNPRLAQGAFTVEAAAGRAVQAGLYPNPVVGVTADEIGDRQGPAGIITVPQVSQEIVTGGKLVLSRAAAERGTDQAALNLLPLRYDRLAAVRRAYYEALALQRRAEILGDLFDLAGQSIRTSEKVVKAGRAARLDLVQLEVERERFRAEWEATMGEVPAAFRRLAAAVGVADLPHGALACTLDERVPAYDLEAARRFISEVHPDILAAKKGVARAQLLLERARAEPKPNVTVVGGYVRQSQNRSNDFLLGVSLPVPLWNRNQGNIAAVQAELGEAFHQVGRAENEVVERLAAAFGTYASARRRAELYRGSVLPRARESYQLALKAYQSGAFDYLRVLEAQRAYSQADLEAVRSLGEAWRAAGDLSGLLLEEHWPTRPGPRIEIIPAPKPATEEKPGSP